MTGYEMTETGMSYLLKTLHQYEYPSVFLFIVLASLILTGIFGRKQGRVIIVYPMILTVLTVLNPYLFPFLLSGRPELNGGFYRALWLLPQSLVTGLGAVLLVRFLHSRLAGGLVLLLFCAAIAVTGNSTITSLQDFNGPETVWGAEADTVAVADAILKDADDESPLVGFETEEAAEELRALHPEIRGVIVDKLSDSHEEDAPSYYVVKPNSAVWEAAKKAGLQAVIETKEKIVFRR